MRDLNTLQASYNMVELSRLKGNSLNQCNSTEDDRDKHTTEVMNEQVLSRAKVQQLQKTMLKSLKEGKKLIK